GGRSRRSAPLRGGPISWKSVGGRGGADSKSRGASGRRRLGGGGTVSRAICVRRRSVGGGKAPPGGNSTVERSACETHQPSANAADACPLRGSTGSPSRRHRNRTGTHCRSRVDRPFLSD